MAIKPQNVVRQLKDHTVIASANMDFSTGSIAYLPFCDPAFDWEVVSITMKMVVAYIASQATNVQAGMDAGPSGAADTDRFALDQSMGAAAIAIASAGKVLTQTAVKILPKGHRPTLTWTTASSQTGEGVVIFVLRPREVPHGNLSKRPGGAAESQT